MSRSIVWLTGPPGSGKTTAGRKAAATLGRPFECAGELFRAQAKQAGLSLEAFSSYAEAHPEVDRRLDAELVDRATPGTVVDGRIVGALMRRQGLPVLAIQVTASEEVRARRVAGRDGVPVAEALEAMRRRSASERNRYLAWYRLDLDVEPFDAVVDASERTPDEVAEAIVTRVRADDADVP